MPVGEQARVFLAMALTGAALGAVYDVLLLLRRCVHAGRILTGAADLAYGAVCALGIVLCALRLQVQAVRWYVFAGTAAGMLLYALSIGTFLRGVGRHVRKFRYFLEKKLPKRKGKAGI